MPNKRPKKRTGRKSGLANPFAKIGRKRYHVQTVARTAEMLRAYNGNLSAVAYAYGITRKAVEKFIHDHADELRPVLQESREITLDTGEFQLMDLVRQGDKWAIGLLLETLGRSRGYVKGIQLGGAPQADGSMGPVAVQIYLPDNGRAATIPGPPVAPASPPAPTDDDSGDDDESETLT